MTDHERHITVDEEIYAWSAYMAWRETLPEDVQERVHEQYLRGVEELQTYKRTHRGPSPYNLLKPKEMGGDWPMDSPEYRGLMTGLVSEPIED